MTSKTNTCSAIDFAKFFCCLCIIALHTQVIRQLPDIIDYYITRIVIRLAVPFFFVASGYFLGKKLNKMTIDSYKISILTYCKRLLLPLLFWELLNIIMHVSFDLCFGLSYSTVIGMTIQSIVFYPYGGLWFVQACIVGALLLYPFLIKQKLDLAICIGLLLFGFALICNNYYFITEGTFMQIVVDKYISVCLTARNGIFFGFIFLALGVKCSTINIENFNVNFFVILALISFMVFEIWYLQGKHSIDDNSTFISHLFVIPLFLILLLKSNFILKEETSILLRNLSVGMFFLHSLYNNVLGIFVEFGILRFVFTLFLSFSTCLFFYKTHLGGIDRLLK